MRQEQEETGFFHVVTRSSGQIALFEDDEDRKTYLRIARQARDDADVRVLAWVLMTDHVHLIVDCQQSLESLTRFMYLLDKEYATYFNGKTGRVGHLLQRSYWKKAILNDRQLVATVHYIHMNPETAGISPMRKYRWSSYQEYAGKHWMVDATIVLGIFGSFEAFDSYEGSSDDVVRKRARARYSDEDVLKMAIECAECSTSNDLRSLNTDDRNLVVRWLSEQGVSTRQIARALGIGPSTAARIARA